MNSRRDPEYFGERNRKLNLEEAFQDLAIFVGFSICAVTAALIYCEAKGKGVDWHSPAHLFLTLLGGLTFVNIAIFVLIRRARGHWQAIEREAGTDKVTGLMNRIHFEKLLQEEFRRSGRYHYSLTLVCLDMDGFSDYNEEFGRKAGDEILKKFADFLRGTVRFADCVSRYHGDEFCVLLPHTDIVRAEKFMSRLIAGAAERLEKSFCAGVTSRQAGESKAQFLMRALAALSQAKREGAGQVRYVVSESSAVGAAGV